MAELPITQFSIPIQFSSAPEHPEWTVSHLLTIFNMEDTACEINEYLMPMSTPQARHLCPAIESMNSFWTAWDESLTELRRYHFAVLDVNLYKDMLQCAQACNFSYTLGVTTAVDASRTCLEVHLVPAPEIYECLGRIYNEFRRQQAEMRALEQQLRDTRNLLGKVVEALGARDESMARELGLVLQAEDLEHPAD